MNYKLNLKNSKLIHMINQKSEWLLLFFVLGIISLSGCKKTDEKLISTDFYSNVDKAYLYQTVYFKAQDSIGISNYNWDFGDGDTENTGFSVSHKYTKPGNYIVSLTISGLTNSKKITVFPGSISYQIKNNTKNKIILKSYIDNPDYYGFKNNELESGKITDTIFSKGIAIGNNVNDLIGIHIFINSTEYVNEPITWASCMHHHIFNLNDSSLFIKMTNQSVGKDSIILGDL